MAKAKSSKNMAEALGLLASSPKNTKPKPAQKSLGPNTDDPQLGNATTEASSSLGADAGSQSKEDKDTSEKAPLDAEDLATEQGEKDRSAQVRQRHSRAARDNQKAGTRDDAETDKAHEKYYNKLAEQHDEAKAEARDNNADLAKSETATSEGGSDRETGSSAVASPADLAQPDEGGRQGTEAVANPEQRGSISEVTSDAAVGEDRAGADLASIREAQAQDVAQNLVAEGVMPANESPGDATNGSSAERAESVAEPGTLQGLGPEPALEAGVVRELTTEMEPGFPAGSSGGGVDNPSIALETLVEPSTTAPEFTQVSGLETLEGPVVQTEAPFNPDYPISEQLQAAELSQNVDLANTIPVASDGLQTELGDLASSNPMPPGLEVAEPIAAGELLAIDLSANPGAEALTDPSATLPQQDVSFDVGGAGIAQAEQGFSTQGPDVLAALPDADNPGPDTLTQAPGFEDYSSRGAAMGPLTPDAVLESQGYNPHDFSAASAEYELKAQAYPGYGYPTDAPVMETLTDHLTVHGVEPQEASQAVQAISSGLHHAVESQAQGPGAQLVFHPHGEVAISVEPAQSAQALKHGTVTADMDTLRTIAREGLSHEGVQAIREHLHDETQGLSRLDIVQTFGTDVVRAVGQEGFPKEPLQDMRAVLENHAQRAGLPTEAVNDTKALQALGEAARDKGNAVVLEDTASGRRTEVSPEELRQSMGWSNAAPTREHERAS